MTRFTEAGSIVHAGHTFRRVILEDDPQPRWSNDRSLATHERFGYGGNTQRLVGLRREMEANGYPNLMDLLDEWRLRTRTRPLHEQREFVETHVDLVRSDPAEREALLLLALIFEPCRRKVSRTLDAIFEVNDEAIRARRGLSAQEAEAIRTLDHDRFAQVTREATFEAIFRWPQPVPRRFNNWLTQVIAMRATTALRANVDELRSTAMTAGAIEAVRQSMLTERLIEAPPLGDADGFAAWLAAADCARLYDEDVVPLFRHGQKQRICDDAVSRLAPRQQQVIDGHYYEGASSARTAAVMKVSRETVYSTRRQAEARLRRDRTFYGQLRGIAAVARIAALKTGDLARDSLKEAA